MNEESPDWQSMLERLIPFLSAGFRAPLRLPIPHRRFGTGEQMKLRNALALVWLLFPSASRRARREPATPSPPAARCSSP